MTLDDFLASELERLRPVAAAGDMRAVAEAFLLLADGWPDWIERPIMEGLTMLFFYGGAPGRGKSGGYAARTARAEIANMRWEVATLVLRIRKGRGTGLRKQAFQDAADMLKNTPARGSAEAIEAAYNRVQRQKAAVA